MLFSALFVALVLGGSPHAVVPTASTFRERAAQQVRHKIFAGITDAGVGLRFDYLDEADMVALVRPSGPALHFEFDRFQYYVVQPVTVEESPDCAAGTELHVYYAIYVDEDAGKTERWPNSLSDITVADTALADRTYLIVAKQQGAQVEVVSTSISQTTFAGFTVDAIDAEVLNVTTGNAFIEADGVTWAQHGDRREWVIHTLVQSLQHMPKEGLRKASTLLSYVQWIPRPMGSWTRPSFRWQQDDIYQAAKGLSVELMQGRSGREKFYIQAIIAESQDYQEYKYDGRVVNEDKQYVPFIHEIVANDEPFDELDYAYLSQLRIKARASDGPLLLNIAENTAHEGLAEWAFLRIARLPTKSEQVLFFRLSQDHRMVRRVGAYIKLLKWRSIQNLTVRTTRERGRIVSIDNEAQLRAAIEASCRP